MIEINGIKYYRQELAYKVGGIPNKIVIYTEFPTDIDTMVNRLVDYRAKEMAKVKLRELIAHKVVELLNLD